MSTYRLATNSLTNGLECKLYITVYDASNNSAISDAIIFKTSSKPIITTNPGTVTSQSNAFTATYSQLENISMVSWQAFLYNYAGTEVLQSSGLQTSSTISYLFSNLQSSTTYKIKFQATSADGLIGEVTAFFSVAYAQPDVQVTVTATNNDNASIKLTGNIVQILGESENTSYIANEEIDTRSGKAWFDTGFNVLNNFTVKYHFREVPNVTINNNTNIKIIECATPPTDTTALWIENSAQATEKELTLVKSNTTPAIDVVWIEDTSLTEETPMTLNVGIVQPTNDNIAWLQLDVDLDSLTILLLYGDEGIITLKHFNNKFYLFRGDIIIDELTPTVTGNSFCIIVQQANGVLSLLEGTD